MKKRIKVILKNLGLFERLKVFKEQYFPTVYERRSRAEQKKYVDFYKQFIQSGDLVFDVGANVGHRTNIFLQIGARVVAIEPQSDLCKYLKAKFGKKLLIENCGLGEKVGECKFFINSAHTLSTFSEDWKDKASENRFSNTSWIAEQIVPIKTLDVLIKRYGHPKFCKIDVEGFELEVLKGLNDTIQFISFEFMLPENRQIIIDCINKIKSLNDKIFLNYSIGDTMVLALDRWMPIENLNDFINLPDFTISNWGDIYIHTTR